MRMRARQRVTDASLPCPGATAPRLFKKLEPLPNGVASKTKIQIEGSLTRFDEQRSRDWQSSAQPAPLTAQSANINDQVVGWHG